MKSLIFSTLCGILLGSNNVVGELEPAANQMQPFIEDFDNILSQLSDEPVQDSWTSRTPASFDSELIEVDCPEDLGDPSLLESGFLTCYTIDVPEDYDAPDDSQRLTLSVAKISASEKPTNADAVIVPGGGPGIAWRNAISSALATMSTHLERDLITFDYRGMGLSTPLIDCTEEFDDLLTEECIKRYKDDGLDLTKYGTVHSALDLETIRKALGIEKVSFMAASYGTQYALVYMHRFPDNVSLAVLEGVAWPGYSGMLNQSYKGVENVANRVIQDCLASEDCPFDDPQGDWDGFLSEVEAADIETQSLLWATWMLGSRLSGIDGSSFLPLVHHSVATQQEDVIQDLIAGTEGAASGVGLGDPTQLSSSFQKINECFDHGPFYSTDRDDAFNGNAPKSFVDSLLTPGLIFVDDVIDRCELLGAYDTKYSSNWLIDPPAIDIPILITGGTYDATTPAITGSRVQQDLPNSKIAYLRGFGHSAIASTNEVSGQALLQFFADPVGFEVPEDVNDIFITYSETIAEASGEADGDVELQSSQETGGAGSLTIEVILLFAVLISFFLQ